MSKAIVAELVKPIAMSYGFMEKFIQEVPDTVWAENFGGWPVWQQVYHAFGAIDFFVLQEGQSGPSPLYSAEIAGLSVVATETADKAQVAAYGQAMQALADAYVEGLDDASLSEKNLGLSSRMDSPTSHAMTLSLLAGHMLYHLGSCDAALRQRGLKGIF